MTQTSK